MEQKLEINDNEKEKELAQIIKEICRDLELENEEVDKEIYDDSIIVDKCRLILKDLLCLLNDFNDDKVDKINIVEDIYLICFKFGITIKDHHELIDNDNEIIKLSQKIATLFIENYANFEYFFAPYTSTCDWQEDATTILKVRSGFEFLCEHYNHITKYDPMCKKIFHPMVKLLNDFKINNEFSDFDYKVKNWENRPIRLKDVPRNISRSHVWWFSKGKITKLKSNVKCSKGTEAHKESVTRFTPEVLSREIQYKIDRTELRDYNKELVVNKIIFEKFMILNKLNDDLKRSVKTVYVFEDYEMKPNVILITNDDIVYCFGNNSKGMLGFGHENKIFEDYIENKDLSGKNLTDFKNTYYNVIARDSVGNVYVWGSNKMGVLGNGLNNENYSRPALNKFLKNIIIIDISCGCCHTIALSLSGKIYAWGCNLRGQVGNGTIIYVLEPYEVNHLNGESVKQISCGFHHSICLTESGSVYSWGRNDFGQLGLGLKKEYVNIPQIILINTIIEKISCGAHHTLLLSNEGEIYVFGCNTWGELGVGIQNYSNVPLKLIHNDKFVAIQAYNRFHTSAALTIKGAIFVWGECKEKKVFIPIERDYECFEDLFADYMGITIRTSNFLKYSINSV